MERLPFRLVIVSLLLSLLVIVLGAYTRLVDAGLGCPDWPTCYGHLWVPKTVEDVAAANLRFAETPVEHDKTWPEQTHRIVAASLGGLFVFIVAVCAWLKFARQQDAVLWHPVAMLLLIICQGLFGMWTVSLLLWPQVVVAHLLGGFATVSLLFLLYLRMNSPVWHFDVSVSYADVRCIRWVLLTLLILVLVQIFLGGWTAANYAAVACADFPRCHNQWWPAADFQQGFNFTQHVGPNYLGGQLDNHARTAIHLAHRVGAVLVTLVSVLAAVLLLRARQAKLTGSAMALMAVLIVQLSLGVSNIVFALPLAVAVAHNAVAAGLLLLLVFLNYKLFTAELSQRLAK